MFDLGRSLLAAVERSPGRTAVVDGTRDFTYARWYDVVQRAAAGLERLGVRHGDRLLIVMQNRWQMAALHWACQCAGIVATPLNWRSTAEEIGYCLEDASAAAIAFDAVAAEAVLACPGARAIPRIAVGAAGADDADGGADGGRAPRDDADADGCTSWHALVAEAPSKPIQRAAPDDLSVMLYTSGTTGRPKGVPRRHRAERAAAIAHVAQNLYRLGETTLGVMPLYHTMGVRSLLSMALTDGGFVCQPRFDPAGALEAIETHRVTNLYLVPTLFHLLLEHRDFSSERVASVTKLGFAGAPMSDGLLRRVIEGFHPTLFVNHYGSSEIYTFTIDQDAAAKPGSSGRAALNQRVRVVPIGAEDARESVPAGTEGEIVADLAGDEAFEGYWNRPDADARSLRDGWYFTGDSGYFDDEGDLFVTGRVDDLIISGGENVSPADVENALSTHPDVEEVAVAGIADERWGKLVTAFVKPRRDVDEGALDEHCRISGLANYKRPRRYVFVVEIPKSPVGKILRRELVAGNYDEIETADGAAPRPSEDL